jgi:hypothetical protein
MNTVEQEVRLVVDTFMKNGELFTALDVSNKVKLTLPFARHSEVRDIVRDLYTTVLGPSSWGRTPIEVTLADGSVREALLYHPLADSWDLDTKYDDQKRAQASVHISTPPAATSTLHISAPISISTPAPAPTPQPTADQLAAKDRWAQLFTSQPSLFPRK